ncbi:MAG: hypothetical protein KJP00_13120 [Bacteroidia bacterium]|nr:hypothetical protein [Bacteroidia bacterium]
MRFLVFLIALFVIGCKPATEKEPDKSIKREKPKISLGDQFELEVGDLLFQDLDCGPFCDAIEKVTFGVNGAQFSHNGIISRIDNDAVWVLEAVIKGVVETQLDSFLIKSADSKGQPKVLVGRLRNEYLHLGPMAVENARRHLGKSYDDYFDILNDRYYCSELLYLAFKEANGGQPVFQLRAMTFEDPDTKEPFPKWVEYFQELNYSIPEGQPGINPGSMSRSIYLDIVHAYGKPEGWRGSTLRTRD